MHIFTRQKEATTRGKDLGSLFEGNSPLQQVKIGGKWREVGGKILETEQIPRKRNVRFQGMINCTI